MPFPLSVNVTPLGSVPDFARLDVGLPVVVTVKLPAVLVVKVVLAPLVIAGAMPVTLKLPLVLEIAAAGLLFALRVRFAAIESPLAIVLMLSAE